MARIRFERYETAVRFLNPLKDYLEDEHRLELRKDPLLGDVSVFNPFLKDKARVFFGETDEDLVAKLAEESQKTCFFCGERVRQETPRFPEGLLPAGRIAEGEAVLFPNLFSLGAFHPVVRLTDAHFLRLSGFSPAIIANGLKVITPLLNAVYRSRPDPLYTAITGNYLFPAGASLVHPHIQALLSPVPYTYHARIIEAGRAYKMREGTSYFCDLIEEEASEGLRYVARTGRWHWLTPFSPMGNNEVMAVHEAESDFGLLAVRDIEDLAAGMSAVLSVYGSLGHLSFNFALYSERRARGSEDSRCLLKIISRQNPYLNYRNDDYFLQKLLQSELIIRPPEELALILRTHFQRKLAHP